MTSPSATTTTEPSVAVVIPCRNEARFIRPVIDSLLLSSYPRERLEVVFVDGMSADGTRAILEGAAREHAFIRVLDNPLMTAPAAMNLGIKATRAEVVVRMDAHAEYARDYIPRCVRLLRSGSKVGNAGGRIVPLPNGESPWARAVAFVTAHRFGVGGTAFRTRARPGLVDTVPFGTFPREALDEVGLYDERLTRNQDNELNARLQKAGYAIAYDPTIRIRYRNQANLKGLVRQAFFTGMWNVYTLFLHPYTWKWRRFVPMGFVAYLAVLAAAASLRAPATAAAALPLGLYAVLVAAFSLESGGTGGGRPRAAATFVSYHLSYGAGSLFGIANLLTGRWRSYLGRPLPTPRPDAALFMTSPSAATTTEPFVAVVIPCRNEARFIRPVIDALLLSSYPRERLEVIFVDGMSTDGTREILENAARRHAFIRVLDNPLFTTPAAMNLGITAARGEIIVRMDAHAEYARDYIARCVRLLLQSGPNVGSAGGRSVPLPDGEGPWSRAVAFVLAHRFGVGGTACRTSARPGLVDTVPFGTFPREVLDEVGLYDERLTRNQDIELNARLQKAGYAIVYDPSIHIGYRRKGLIRQAFFTGMWNVYTLSLHPYTWKWRHFIPMGFVAYLAALACAASLRVPGTAVAALPLGLYAALVAAFSLESGGTGGGRLRVAAIFASYHLSYGAGSLFGIANLLTGRWRSYLGRPVSK